MIVPFLVSIAAKKDNQIIVWNIMGDGAFNMCYRNVIASIQYDLPVVSTLSSPNAGVRLHQNKCRGTDKHLFGVELLNADCTKIAEEAARYVLYS